MEIITLAAIKHRICCAETIVKRLNPRVFRRRAVSNQLKGKFVNTAIFASLLYGLQYSAAGKREHRCLDGYFLLLAKRVMRLPHDFHLAYAVAEERLGVHRPSVLLGKERVRWIGHVMSSEDVILREVLMFIPEGGSRGRGRPRRRFFDTIKADLALRDFEPVAKTQDAFWASVAAKSEDRIAWRMNMVNAIV